MKKPRHFHDKIHEVLSLTQTPRSPTELFWRARLGGKQYSSFKQVLFDAGLLEEVKDGKLHTTEKGQQWICAFNKVKKLMEPEKHE